MRTSAGNQSVTGVGFRPDVVLHAYLTHLLTASPTTSRDDAGLGLGAMDADGDEWATAMSVDSGANPSNTQRGQQTDACLYAFNFSNHVTKEASWVSMDADGFTLNFSVASSHASQAYSLALKGVNVKVGSFNKSTSAAPASQSVTGVGFEPKLIFLASFQEVTQISPVDEARLGWGASDGTTSGNLAIQDEHSVSASGWCPRIIAQGLIVDVRSYEVLQNSTYLARRTSWNDLTSPL